MPNSVGVWHTPDLSRWVIAMCVAPQGRSQEAISEPWGRLTYRLEDGVITLLWSGVGPFQVQISYDLETWHNEGSPMQGPAEITVTPREGGGPQYFRVVPCEAPPDVPDPQ